MVAVSNMTCFPKESTPVHCIVSTIAQTVMGRDDYAKTPVSRHPVKGCLSPLAWGCRKRSIGSKPPGCGLVPRGVLSPKRKPRSKGSYREFHPEWRENVYVMGGVILDHPRLHPHQQGDPGRRGTCEHPGGQQVRSPESVEGVGRAQLGKGNTTGIYRRPFFVALRTRWMAPVTLIRNFIMLWLTP